MIQGMGAGCDVARGLMCGVRSGRASLREVGASRDVWQLERACRGSNSGQRSARWVLRARMQRGVQPSSSNLVRHCCLPWLRMFLPLAVVLRGSRSSHHAVVEPLVQADTSDLTQRPCQLQLRLF